MKRITERQKRSLYESIMKEISRTVKKRLNEDNAKKTDYWYGKWFGTDASLEESLFEYGFIMRYSKKYNEYQVLYHIPFDGDEERFYYTWFDFDGVLKGLKTDDEWYHAKQLGDMCGLSAEEYIESVEDRPETLLNDIISYYGTEDIFGTEYGEGWTEDEIREELADVL